MVWCVLFDDAIFINLDFFQLLIIMSTRVLAAPVLLDVRMSLPSYSRLGGGGRPRIVPNAGCLSRVKRCLFGPSSPGEALQQAADELQRQTESDSKRWNFDFVRDKPLDGPLNWQLAEPHSNRMETTTDPVSPARLRQSQITGKFYFSCCCLLKTERIKSIAPK